MRFLTLWLLLAGLAACGDAGPPNGAVRVTVTYLSYTPACIRVSASDGQGNSAETDIPRSAFKNPEARELTIAVFRKPEWSRQLTLEATSFDASSEERCSGKVLERHLSPEPIAVSPGNLARHTFELQARDDDGDGHVLKTAEVAGTDCVDSRRDIHPGVPEVCTGTEDFDCDGATACADSDCLDKSCNDQNPCTENDACAAGSGSTAQCRGTPKQCSPPHPTCYTNESVCDPGTGNCVHTQEPPDKLCNDNNACTNNDQCGVDAACRGTPVVQCNTPPGQCYESAGTCGAATGTCSYAFKGPTQACNDENACTTNDACNGSGGCAGTALLSCTPSSVCHKSERLACPASADCTESVDATKVNTPCIGAAGSGVCRLPDGACSSFPYIPRNFDPDAIPVADTGLDLHISCGTLADPVVFNTSGTPTWTAPAGCTLPPLPTTHLITQGGIETVVVPVRNLTLAATSAVKIIGSRPVILAVYGNATLSGALLADADHEVPGPGGNRAGCNTQKGADGQFNSGEGSGGGGGGFGTVGGAGGSNDSGQVSNGGTTSSTAEVPLAGGCPGGRGGSTTAGGAGGGGGGALEVAVAGTLRVAHWISVSGGGARGGAGSQDANNEGGGGGGGSGGGLLLEAFRLEITDGARLTANGGAGAEGGDNLNRKGSDGLDGSQQSKDPATCPDVGGNGGPGARGAAEGVGANPGGGGPNNAGGGGGGGGVGVIRLKGYGSCAINPSCDATDNAGCDISPKVTPVCPP